MVRRLSLVDQRGTIRSMRSIGYNLSSMFAPEGRRFIKRPIVGSMWRNHVTCENWTVIGVDVTPGYVELRRDGCQDLATPITNFHRKWSEVVRR